MKILVTGANGFVGKNLVATLNNIKYGYDHYHTIDGVSRSDDLTIMTYDRTNTYEQLDQACQDCDFVFHLAGVSRPKDTNEFMEGNYGLIGELLECLEKHDNKAPIMLASSIQASLSGRYANSEYGMSKKAGERLVRQYGQDHDIPVYIYRFANLFGKWCRPNYNSVVATFCYNLAHDLPITINDPTTVLEMQYIDDVVDELIHCLNGQPTRCNFEGTSAIIDNNGRYCTVYPIHTVSLQEIVDDLTMIKDQVKTLMMPSLPDHSFIKALYSTYLSYLPDDKVMVDLTMHEDDRGSFTEVMKTDDHGQFSINVSKPGQTKGNHWHHSKWEYFIVVSGHALIQQQQIGRDEKGQPYPIHEFHVSGDKLQAVHMLPGYSHNIINESTTENLVTLMWANECFDPTKPDTYTYLIDKGDTHAH